MKPHQARAGNPRAAAVQLLQQLRSGRSLSDLLPRATPALAPRDRPLFKELCFGTARWWLRLSPLLELLLRHPMKPRDEDLRTLILVGLYQLAYLRTAPHAAVAETVEVTRLLGKPWAAGLVNGLLRRFQRERAALLARVDRDPAARHAHPRWLCDALRQAWPDQWEPLLQAANQRPPMTLRVNLARIGRQAYFEQLRAAAIPARPVPGIPSAVVLDRALEVGELPGFEQGLVSVQDAAAQLAAGLLGLQPGQRVLDVCAAPGGKSAHILESVSGDLRLTAVDIDRQRVARIHDTLQRLGLQAEVIAADATRPAGSWARQRYDRILLDAPCSATGVIRRHPDIKLLRRASDIPRLVALQSRLLEAVWPLLQPGGMLLYATCSLLPEENQGQIERFLEATPDARAQQPEAGWGHARGAGRQTLPGEETMDGFFYACLWKT